MVAKFKILLLLFFPHYGLANKEFFSGKVPNVLERSQELHKRLKVTWTVDFTKGSIHFIVTALTHGFIGFGISPQGGMGHADLIIGGVLENGKSYFTDRYSKAKKKPKIDKHQDWFFQQAHENETHTVLHFNRSLETCDPQDISITNDTIKFIWSLGASDEIEYHGENRGSAAVLLLDANSYEVDTSNFDVWKMRTKILMPSRPTTYWCSLHKSPVYKTKRQITGLKVILDNEVALRHVHHFDIYRCFFKHPLTDELLKLLSSSGEDCSIGEVEFSSQRQCYTTVYIWSKGGHPLFLPQDVGLYFNEEGVEEYFYMQMHYDNPNQLSGLTVETGVDIYNTENLREHEGAVLQIGTPYTYTLMIPPEAPNHVTVGHCSSHCTGQFFPPEGLNVFNIALHTHLNGRKLKLRHFRPTSTGNFTELQWISFDDNYDFDYQQNRQLSQMVKLMPGDHLTMECNYNSEWKKPPSVTLGGLGTTEEMCFAFVYYYPRIHLFDICASHPPESKMFKLFDIQEIDRHSPDNKNPIITKPEKFKNHNMSTVLTSLITWTPELRRKWQKLARYSRAEEMCRYANFSDNTAPKNVRKVKYPHTLNLYEPKSATCPQQRSL